MSDTMEVTLGRDQGIISTRKKIKEEHKKVGLLRRNLKVLTFEIEVRNNSKGTINLTLEDQIPVTSNEDITIKLVEDDSAIFNETTGKLTWKVELKPGGKRTFTFTYSVEHDKDKPVS